MFAQGAAGMVMLIEAGGPATPPRVLSGDVPTRAGRRFRQSMERARAGGAAAREP